MSQLATVIIPVYNRSHLITRCLESVNNQTYGPLEVIIVDNNSTDGTLDTVRNWIADCGRRDIEWHTTVCTTPGAAAARNFGEKSSTGDYLFFFDSDDVMRPDYVKNGMDVFLQNPHVDLVGWRVAIHGPGKSLKITHDWNKTNEIDRHLVDSVYRTQGYGIRRSVLKRAGNWNPDAHVWNDWELGVRLILSNLNCFITHKITADVYHQDESITGTSFKSKAGQWEKILDHSEELILQSSHPQKSHMARVIAYRRIILAAIYHREGEPNLSLSLYYKALQSPQLNILSKFALNIAYRYTRLGGRGAFRIIGFLL